MVAINMEIESEIDVKHVKDIIQFTKSWNEGDRFEGDGVWEHDLDLVHIYESDRSIFKVSAKGYVISSEFKKK